MVGDSGMCTWANPRSERVFSKCLRRESVTDHCSAVVHRDRKSHRRRARSELEPRMSSKGLTI